MIRTILNKCFKLAVVTTLFATNVATAVEPKKPVAELEAWLGVRLGCLCEELVASDSMINEALASRGAVPRWNVVRPLPVKGAFVREVYPKSAALEAGIQEGDIVLSFASSEIQDDAHLRKLIQDTKDSEPLQIEVLRNGEKLGLSARLKFRKAFVNQPEAQALLAKVREKYAKLEKIKVTGQIKTLTAGMPLGAETMVITFAAQRPDTFRYEYVSMGKHSDFRTVDMWAENQKFLYHDSVMIWGGVAIRNSLYELVSSGDAYGLSKFFAKLVFPDSILGMTQLFPKAAQLLDEEVIAGVPCYKIVTLRGREIFWIEKDNLFVKQRERAGKRGLLGTREIATFVTSTEVPQDDLAPSVRIRLEMMKHKDYAENAKVGTGALIEVESLTGIISPVDGRGTPVVFKTTKPIIEPNGTSAEASEARILGVVKCLDKEGRVDIELTQLAIRRADGRRTVVDIEGWIVDAEYQKGLEGTRLTKLVKTVLSQDDVVCKVGGSEGDSTMKISKGRKSVPTSVIEIQPGKRAFAVISKVKV